MPLVSILISLLVLCLIWWVAKYIATSFGAPPPILVIINVVFAVLLLIWLIQLLGGGLASPIILR
jgi:hypothetical protein